MDSKSNAGKQSTKTKQKKEAGRMSTSSTTSNPPPLAAAIENIPSLNPDDEKFMQEVMVTFDIKTESTTTAELHKTFVRLEMDSQIKDIMKLFTAMEENAESPQQLLQARTKEPNFNELLSLLATDTFQGQADRDAFVGDLFRMLDSDNDGYISIDDFTKTASLIGEAVSEYELHQAIEQALNDRSIKKLSKSDFQLVFNSLAPNK